MTTERQMLENKIEELKRIKKAIDSKIYVLYEVLNELNNYNR